MHDIISKSVCFSLTKNIETLKTWTAADYKRVIEIANKVKQRQLVHLIEIFRNPEKYSYNGEITMKDYFISSESVNNDVNKSP